MQVKEQSAENIPTPPRIARGYKANFEQLQRAFRLGDVALVSAIEKQSGEARALVCAMQGNQDGTITPVPFAVMVWGNPFEMFHDPTV